jgi:glycosyltransferase involved in cell wall biosynthesis
MITYNHENYISTAIEGVLMQKTSFPFELVIGEDCSTDNTRYTCIDYRNRFSDIIKMLLPNKNQGMINNFIETMKACQGKYIAICEGDDYWIDNCKLQKQVDFLESKPQYGLCFTDADVLFSTTDKICKSFDLSRKKDIPTGDVLNELIYRNPYKTCTAMFRSSAANGYTEILDDNEFQFVDFGLWLFIASKFKVGYLKESTSVYRVLKNSASNFNSYEEFNTFIKSWGEVRSFFIKKYMLKVSKTKTLFIRLKISLAFIIKNKKIKSFIEYIIKIISRKIAKLQSKVLVSPH